MFNAAHKSFIVRFPMILILILGMLGISPIQPAAAAPITVINTADSGPGSLRQAIADAASADTITFDPSLSGQTITLASTLVIGKNLTIDGSSLASKISISGNNSTSVFQVISGVVVTIKNLIIQGGSGGAGGAINNLGTLNVANSSVLNNHAYAGAGIYNGGANINATLLVTNSVFSNNIASENGGSIYNYNGTLVVSSSTFSNNAAQRGAGLEAVYGTVTVNNSSFSNNVADIGGGIDNGFSAKVTISAGTFSNNSAGSGGAIYNNSAGGILTVTNSVFSNNVAGGGGGIYNGWGLTLSNNTFQGNNADTLGGGILNDLIATLIMNNNTFSENGAHFYGGAIYNRGQLNYRNTILANSTSGSDCYQNDQGSTTGSSTNNLVETNTPGPNNCGVPLLTDDPKLGTLANNGGPTQTMALLSDSPAIDAGDDASCPQTDQRGVTRPQESHCDIGAYEYEIPDASVGVTIGDSPVGNYSIPTSNDLRVNYAGLDNGPVKVTSTNGKPIVAALRDLWSNGSEYTSSIQLMGLPQGLISDTYLFPSYNNVSLNDQLRFGNVGNATTTVTVTIGGQVMGTYILTPGQRQKANYPGLDSGPVIVKSSNGVPIIASIRDAWINNGVTSSFSQLMGLPQSQLSDTYIFPSYNNVSLSDQLRFGNVGNATTTVTVTIGGVVRGTYDLLPNQRGKDSYVGLDSGPVVVKSSNGVPIIASLREVWLNNGVTTSYFQMMGLPQSQLSDKYVFPSYDNVTLSGQLRFGNVGNANTTVTVTIGGQVMGTYDLLPNQRQKVSYNVDDGPVVVQSSNGVPIIAALRDAWLVNGVTNSFSQLMGLPGGQLSTSYVFPSYNNATYDNQLRIGVP